MSQCRRTGLLGGTFNPVHRGHIELGLKIKAAFGLDRILYILSAQPPHKKQQTLPAAELRLAMLQAALRPHPGLLPCDLELHRSGDSWTIDTIRVLKASHPGERFYFITGSDGFLKIRTWKEYRRLLREVFFIIVLRKPGHRLKVEQLLREEGIPFGPGCENSPGPPAAFLHAYVSDYLKLSATDIRRKMSRGQDISPYVENNVRQIMEEIKLYEEG
jgi:nicotinate-nucleotide adenylyltransferase